MVQDGGNGRAHGIGLGAASGPLGGANQRGVRAHNERLLLSTIQRMGSLAGSQLARETGLSAQTVSNILRELEDDGLVARCDPQRGRVGKPSIPIRLVSEGALSLGLKVGRRSAELALMGLDGTIRAELSETYHYPQPLQILDFLKRGMSDLVADMPKRLSHRLCGIGIAAPGEIWNWKDILGVPANAVEAWRGWDLVAEVRAFTDLPVYLVNDATAACRAETVFGGGRRFRDYAYLYVGALIGGGIVLDSAVWEGHQNNAGAFGPLRSTDAQGRSVQLIETASLYLLEAALAADGHDPSGLRAQPFDWSPYDAQVTDWIQSAAPSIAAAALSACSVIDFEAIVIDGAFPADVRHRLVRAVQQAITMNDTQGVILPQIEAGTVGANARVIGAAYGPIAAQHFVGAGPR